MEPKTYIARPTWKEQGYVPQRYVVAGLTFLGMAVNYMMRININLAIIAMVKHNDTTAASQQSGNNSDECKFKNDNQTISDTISDGYNGEFEWDEFTQSLVLGSFFCGYFWTQIPGGRLAEMWGSRLVFGGAMTITALMTLLIPIAAHQGFVWLIAIRAIIGLAEGPATPSTHALLSCWAPQDERATLSALVYTGCQAGTVITYPLTGAIIESIGWEAVFYIQGSVALVWAMLWFFIVSDAPDRCRFASQIEKNYINQSLGRSKEKKAAAMPWKKAMSSMPLWAILVAGAGHNWGFYTLLTDLPLYMKEILKQNITSNAFFSAAPYVGMMVFSIILSNIGDFIVKRKIASVAVVRKVATTIAHVGPAICLICVTLVECDKNAIIMLICFAVTLQGGVYTGFFVNHIDIAPNYAGSLHGITNAVATIPGWMAPMTVGALTNNNQTLEQWRKVFFITASFFCLDATFYIIFGSGTEQSWNRINENITEESQQELQQLTQANILQEKKFKKLVKGNSVQV